MNKLDFLSGAPKTLIFEKSSNKTNFGGSLTILYLIILLVIIIIYMVNYAINPKYSVLYTYEHQFNADTEYIDKRYNNTDLNPKITFNFKMGEEYNASHFGVLYRNNKTNMRYIVEFGKDYTENLYDLIFLIFYLCNNTNNTIEGNCDLHDKEKEQNKYLNEYDIIFNYTGDRVDHQNSDSPIKKTFIQDVFIFSIEDKISFNYLRWKTIKYTEERGIMGLFDRWLGISNEVYGGSFMEPLAYKFNTSEYLKNEEKNGLKVLGLIAMDKSNPNNYIDLYSRTKRSIFDPIANICSLALTIYNAFILVFCGFYSNNYDNYKIVKKILSKGGKPYNKINEKRELLQLSDDLDKNDALIKSNIKNNEEENIIADDNEEEENNIYNINEQNEFKIHPKLHFYDFLFNNFYCKKCCNSNKQNFVSTCNEIVSRYNSVDYILYNQIKLENLFKDYKWNDPKLNDINNNQLIMDLNLFAL